MEIGYACLTEGVYNTDFKTCTLKTATRENLLRIIDHNLHTLERIINYNINIGINFFRLSSDIIPFGSSPVNDLDWDIIFKEKFQIISKKIKEAGIRISMHPGQYTVLNSPKEEVVERAIEDLEYHNRFLNALDLDRKSKIILHIGGVYGEKESAIERFEENYSKLSQDIKGRLIIENDDKSYTIGDVLKIGKKMTIPVVYDNLHNRVNPFDESKDDSYFIKLARETWSDVDGKQKIHYSQSADGKISRSHSRTIDLEIFQKFLKDIPSVDIMLEVKDKNISAIKVKNLIDSKRDIRVLEEEWARYKYNVLEHSPSLYSEIRNLLKEKSKYPVVHFYKLIDEALIVEADQGHIINSLSHVWGYFKDIASDKEKKKYDSYINAFIKGTYSVNAVKNLLLKMAVKYDKKYLLESYFYHF